MLRLKCVSHLIPFLPPSVVIFSCKDKLYVYLSCRERSRFTFDELNTFDTEDSDSLLSEPGDTLRFFRFPLGLPFSFGAR